MIVSKDRVGGYGMMRRSFPFTFVLICATLYVRMRVHVRVYRHARMDMCSLVPCMRTYAYAKL